MERMTLDRFVEMGLDRPDETVRKLSPDEERRKAKILARRRKAGKAAEKARKRQRKNR